MFSKIEQDAIQEKIEQLKKIKEGKLKDWELADLITTRRISWLEKNLDKRLIKYKKLSPEEQAYRIIFFDHMKINPVHSKMTRISRRKIRIDSYNFCPYLEACKKLKLETRFICKKIGEPSIKAMLKMINPRLVFSRDYRNIRPYNGDFCEEYIEFA